MSGLTHQQPLPTLHPSPRPSSHFRPTRLATTVTSSAQQSLSHPCPRVSRMDPLDLLSRVALGQYPSPPSEPFSRHTNDGWSNPASTPQQIPFANSSMLKHEPLEPSPSPTVQDARYRRFEYTSPSHTNFPPSTFARNFPSAYSNETRDACRTRFSPVSSDEGLPSTSSNHIREQFDSNHAHGQFESSHPRKQFDSNHAREQFDSNHAREAFDSHHAREAFDSHHAREPLDESVGRLAKVMRTSKDTSVHKPRSQPSRFCHICSRTSKKVGLVSCGNFATGACRKVICQKCFVDHEWDWDEAVRLGSDWICTHCRQKCPDRAQCAIYRRTNERRREQQQYQRALKAEGRSILHKQKASRHASRRQSQFTVEKYLSEDM